MPPQLRLLYNPDIKSTGGDVTIRIRCEDDAGAPVVPDTLPVITVSRFTAGAWADVVATQNTLNEVDDTATINGTDYYYTFTPGAHTAYSIVVEAEVDGEDVVGQGQAGVDATVPGHIHDGNDSPRVSWFHLKDVPDDANEPDPDGTVIITVEDLANQAQHGLKEAAVVEKGYDDATTEQARAGALLGDRKGIRHDIRFRHHFDVAPKVGDVLRFKDQGTDTYEVTSVEEIEPGLYEVTAGARRTDAEDAEHKEKRRLDELARYG